MHVSDHSTYQDNSIATIIDWIKLKNDKVIDIKNDIDLIENRIIDSLDFMEFILLIEELTGRSNLIADLTVDHFRTLNSIRKHILS